MRIVPFLKVIRVGNGIIVVASVYLGALFAGVLGPSASLLLACLSAFLIASGGYSINDYFDYATDSINKPLRPIPRGELRRDEVLVLSLILMGTGVAIAQFIGRGSGVVAVCAAVLLFLYSYRLKRLALAGNLVVSLLCGLVFLYAGLSVGELVPVLIPSVFSFLFHLGREILKDVEDMEGDRKTQVCTIPIRWGVRTAVLSSTLIYLSLMALTPLPYLVDLYRLRYLVAVILAVDLPLALVITHTWKPHPRWGHVSTVLKIMMPVGLLALYLGV
jgi:geranylgeranylglycerol-phosphate geranylgeranyltransferase